MSKTRENVAIRLSVEDAQKATAALKKFGKDGQGALEAFERASNKPSRGLLALDKGVAGATGKLRHMGQVAGVINGPLGGVASRFSGMAGLISGAGLAVGGFTLGIGALAFGLKRSVTAFMDFERSQMKTAALLRATGNVSGLTAKQIEEMAVALGRGTLASVAGARNAANALLTFKSVSGDAFKKTLYLAQDLAASGFGTLEGNVIQLGKALEDPTLGLTALRRVGVSFTEQQKEMIKVMAEAGDVAGYQRVMFEALREQVGGAGLAEATETLAGAFDTLGENVNLFMEAMGRDPGSIFATAANVMAKDIERLTDYLYPSKIAQLKELGREIEAIEAGITRHAGHSGARALERALAEKKKEYAVLAAEVNDRSAELKAQKSAQEAKDAAAAEALAKKKKKNAEGWARVVLTVDGLRRKARQESMRKEEAARRQHQRRFENDRKAGLSRLASLEDRAARETLSKSELLVRGKAREFAEIDALRAKGLISLTEDAKARADVETYYAKKTADEKKRLAEQTFGGQAMKQVDGYFDALNNGGKRAGAFLVSSFKSIEDALTTFFQGGKVSFRDFMTSIKAGLARLAAQDVIAGIGGALGLGSSSAPGGGSIIGSVVSGAGSFIKSLFAEGGRVSGPGTETSDSIIARLSDGEFVVNARATRRHLPLLEAINNDGRGYAAGGLVANDNLPGFSLGGSVTSPTGDPSDRSKDRGGLTTDWGSESPGGGESNKSGKSDKPDTRGFWDRVKDFFFGPTKLSPAGVFQTPWMAAVHGNVTGTGFAGSEAAGGLLGVLGGLIGGLPGLVFSAFGNLARAAHTGGLAQGTGLSGVVYDLWSGRKTVGGIVDNLMDRFGGGKSLASAGLGRPGGGEGLAAMANDNPAARVERARFDAGAGLAGFADSLEGGYRGVEQTGMRVLRGLRRGGAFHGGEEFLVGEEGPEILRPARPGTITPMERAAPRVDTREMEDLLRRLLAEQEETRRVLARTMTQMSAFASSYATGAAVRRTAA